MSHKICTRCGAPMKGDPLAATWTCGYCGTANIDEGRAKAAARAAGSPMMRSAKVAFGGAVGAVIGAVITFITGLAGMMMLYAILERTSPGSDPKEATLSTVGIAIWLMAILLGLYIGAKRGMTRTARMLGRPSV